MIRAVALGVLGGVTLAADDHGPEGGHNPARSQMHDLVTDPAAPPGSEAAGEAIEAASEAELAAADSMRRFGVAEAPAKPAGAFRLATYNLENLFDNVDDPKLSGKFEDIDDAKPASEMVAEARAIRRLDADVLCVEEVESKEALLAFRDTYLKGLGYDYVVSIDAGDERGIEQSVLSRFPVGEAHNWPQKPLGGVHPAKYGNSENWYAGQAINFHRSPLMVDVTVPAGARGNADPYTVTLVVVHHKSGRYSDYWREAEAKGAVELIDQARSGDPDKRFVVLGDFNNEASSESAKVYLRAGFTDAFAGRTGPEVVSHESGRRIDLILLGGKVKGEVVAGSAFVLGTPARPNGVDWRDLPTFPGYASDHYPVAVDIRVGDEGESDGSGGHG
ncbi:MAG: endonuclease/exonuclease/phosphatase family protein [Phycisphaerales bacterium]